MATLLEIRKRGKLLGKIFLHTAPSLTVREIKAIANYMHTFQNLAKYSTGYFISLN
jgi:hypothetical protein